MNKLPKKAATILPYNIIIGGKIAGNKIDKPTINPAPLLIPNKPESAKGLRNNPCITAPEVANAIPTITANRMRGKRIFSQMFNELKSNDNEDNCENGDFNGPALDDIMIKTKRMTNSPHNKKR